MMNDSILPHPSLVERLVALARRLKSLRRPAEAAELLEITSSLSPQGRELREEALRLRDEEGLEDFDREFKRRNLEASHALGMAHIFENRGEAVGVTMIHPHGQLYAYPFIPLRVATELESARLYQEEKSRCLFCDLLEHEVNDEARLVYRSRGYTAFVPFFAHYPYSTMVVPDQHLGSIAQMGAEQKRGLALALKCIVGGYDNLFGIPFPYMMCMHQDPTDGGEYPHYHFHIEFYPPMRSRDTLKYNASSETGAWAHINPTSPEEKAGELRERIGKRLDELGQPR